MSSRPLSSSGSRSLEVVHDEAWLERCTFSMLRRENDLTWFTLQDRPSGTHWLAARAPIQLPGTCQRLERDFHLRLDPAWAIAPVAFIRSAEGPLLIYPASGTPLMDLIGDAGLPLGRLLAIAVAAANALASAQNAGVRHASLLPHHLMVETADSVRLLGFHSHAAEVPTAELPGLEQWPYLAPEQVRRDAASFDARSDIYALTVILYQALTGRLPLTARDPSQWLHVHAAVQPQSPAIHVADLPEGICQVLLKGLAKEPGARYQRAESMAADLAWCQQQWLEHERIDGFRLGAFDALPSAARGDVLFGREAERMQLIEQISQVRSDGIARVLLVGGAPGAGKSTLIHQGVRPLAPGYWASGKSNLLQQEIPYAPLAEILKSLMTQLLGKPALELETLGEQLVERLKGRGKLLAELAPEAELVIGVAPELPNMPARHALDRANQTLLDVLEVFAQPGRPLVLFIDDVQWADDSTLSFLQAFIARPPRHLALILAYREAESQSLQREGGLLQVLEHGQSLPCTSVMLGPLSVPAVAELIAAELDTDPEAIESLAPVVHYKTAGNPLFISQVLRALIDERLVCFDVHGRRWTWNQEEVDGYRYADNVADLMVQRFERLAPMEREVLRTAGYVGGRCDESLLHRLLPCDQQQINREVQSLVDAGFLLREREQLVFPHDRVLEAACQLAAPAGRAAEHARIAVAMLDQWGEQIHERVFEVASQVQRIDVDKLEAHRRAAFVELLVEAAERARDTAAVEQAVGYLRTAERLLGQTGWSSLYTQAFATQWLAAECDMLLADLASAQHRLDDCLNHATTALDRAKTYRLRATLRTLHSDYEGAITEALTGLTLLDIPLQRKPSHDQLSLVFAQVRALVGARRIADLVHLPKADDPLVEVAMELLSTLISSFFVNDDIRFLHLAKMVELTLMHGTTPSSGYGFAWFGVMIAERYGEYVDGQSFAEVALELTDKHGYEAGRTGTLVALDQVSPWTRPMAYARQKAFAAFECGQAGGDLGMSCYACNHIGSDLLFMGEPLQRVLSELEHGLAWVRQFHYIDIERILLAQQAYASDLRDGRQHRPLTELDGTEHDRFGPIDRTSVSQPTLFWTWLYSGMSAFYYGDIPYALRRFEEAAALTWSIPAHINLADYYLFYSLALGSAQAPGEVAEKLEQLERQRLRFLSWVELNPATFRSKLLLIEGVIARLRGQELVAIRCFDQSQIAAAAAGFIHEQALAHEQLADICLPNGLVSGANHHLRVARDCYNLWGANSKARQLEALHPFLNTESSFEPVRPVTQVRLDLEVGIEAARALSQEVLLERLVETLMNHLMIQAGADHGVLMIVSGAELQLAATASVEAGNVRVALDTGQPLEQMAPASVLNASKRTRNTLVLDDARADCPEAYSADLLQRQTRSMLCLPLLRQGTLIGLVYLENSLVPKLFSAERLTMLEILASQAAVSLHTARLYAQLVEDTRLRAQMEADLRSSRAELARSSHLKVMGELSASIAHEISQPLLGILSNASASLRWLKRDQPDLEEAIQGLEDIRSDSARAADIIQALRALAKQAPLQRLPVQIDELIGEVVRLTATDLANRNVQLQTRLDAQCPVWVDAVQIQQVVFNLITNAQEAIVGAGLPDGRIIIGSAVKDDHVQVCFQDNGPGIDAPQREQIFDAFYTTKGSGMGMGLAICRSVIGAHGGTLVVQDSEQGARICFNLPIAAASVG
ncbi:putative ATPase [Pseudomonas sp. KD5]|jgi:predicted ATPase/signal transduction histidine kinase|uniref:ATPase/signal transduction histidine kinase n=1 Tax=Pseudomonas umsongensis TaxID=198618 RepID=A0ACC5MD04_9PSED|nr:putative ATPase/signal transduction histidine kinase [Pseudomonas umsongensis]NMN78149.1 putative ATPase [Pseudomonas sp. KD5]